MIPAPGRSPLREERKFDLKTNEYVSNASKIKAFTILNAPVGLSHSPVNLSKNWAQPATNCNRN